MFRSLSAFPTDEKVGVENVHEVASAARDRESLALDRGRLRRDKKAVSLKTKSPKSRER